MMRTDMRAVTDFTARVRKIVVETPLLVHPHHRCGLSRGIWYDSFAAIGELGFVFGFVEVLDKQFHNHFVVLWKVDLGFCSFLTTVSAGCNRASCSEATYLAGETTSALEEPRASANNGFMHMVRVAATSDDKV
jgi:hypothetical protein